MSNPIVSTHPLVQHKLHHLRNRATSPKEFRALLREITLLMAFEVTRDLPLQDDQVETPLAIAKTRTLAGPSPIVVPILRAGLAMVDPFLELLPQVRVGHIGLYRDETTFKPVEYYYNMPPDVKDSLLILVDPMLATGGSACAAISLLKKRGAQSIRLVSIISAPEGIRAVGEAHPDVQIFTGVVDERLNAKAYIVPGLGDAGDRVFGTK